MDNAPKATEILELFKKEFKTAELINSMELKNWKEIARKYKGVKITFDRKWFSETDTTD